jgi:hypothetical protein
LPTRACPNRLPRDMDLTLHVIPALPDILVFDGPLSMGSTTINQVY